MVVVYTRTTNKACSLGLAAHSGSFRYLSRLRH